MNDGGVAHPSTTPVVNYLILRAHRLMASYRNSFCKNVLFEYLLPDNVPSTSSQRNDGSDGRDVFVEIQWR